MSIQTKPGDVQERVSDKDVEKFLQQHPDFFEKHTQLLTDLKVPHVTGGAVSLVERQVDVLRKQNRKLQKQLDDLVQIARDNERLNRQVYKLTLNLMEADSVSEVVNLLVQNLKTDFAADAVALRIVATPKVVNALNRREFISNADDLKQLFGKIFEDGRPLCGRLKQTQREFLFAGASERIGSVALLPLMAQKGFGLLAIGSFEDTRFHPGMGTVYLNQMSHLISKAVLRFIETKVEAK
ncbi:MAG: DUF484 family protein [Gammaproteobacteria bacterium]|jgi:uncharacterized protein YigA (DUF484 family)|nr:DUF484 family protein [Gammaproteobacteria bacterium]